MTITDDTAAKLREAAEKATPGPWDVWREPTETRNAAIDEFTDQVMMTDEFAGAVFLLNANGKCPASTGCGPTSEANAAFIALANPQTVLALLDERDELGRERNVFKAKDASKSKLLERFRDKLLNMCDHFEDESDRVYFGSTNDPDDLREIAREMDAWKWDAIMGQTKSDPYADLRFIFARSTALEAERDAEKARADAAERSLMVVQNAAKTIASAQGTELEHRRQNAAYDHRIRAEHESLIERDAMMTDALLAAEATISTLTAERDALKRERDEARAAHDGWNPIATCPIREPVDLWCVYGGEEYAQYEGGASIGKLVPNRVKTKEYGFFGNQSDNGVPQRDAPDLVPVAWRKAVPSCPAIIIAEALHIPITLEAARAVLARTGEPTDE